ncbi:MAG: copper resistance protein CopC [Candidatus Limnocylindrales bacterium]
MSRVVLAAALALGLALAAPVPAAGHAALVLADPAAGTGLPQGPSQVVLKFDEPLDLRLSRIVVLDTAGHDVATGSTQPVTGDADAMRRTLGLLPTGIYSVQWTSVSRIDGHTLHGTYLFGVGTAVSGTVTDDASSLDTNGPLDLIGRLLALLGLTLWAGTIVLRQASVRAGLRPDRFGRLGATGPPLTLLGAALSVVSTAAVTAGSLAAIPTVLDTNSGLWQILIMAAAIAGLAGPGRPRAFAVAGTVAIVAEAASGHPAATPLPLASVPIAAAHLAAAGVWIVAIAGSALAAADLRRALATFTPYAVAAAIVVGLTGLANAAGQLTGPADLTGTGYGAFVLAKGGLFLLVAALGLTHFIRRRGPTGESQGLARPARLELGAILVALAVAATMTGVANPPRETAAKIPLAPLDPVLATLGSQAALSVAGASGPFVVGLTILPPRPGPVEVRIQAVGVEAGDGLRNARVIIRPAGPAGPMTFPDPARAPPAASASPPLAVAGSASAPIIVALQAACGLGCFAGRGTIPSAGTWSFAVAADSNRGPIAITERLALPAADGTAAFRSALAAMDALHSASLHETLAGAVGARPIVAAYRFRAPNAMAITVEQSERRLVGTAAYDQEGDGPWQASAFPAPGFSWPKGYFQSFWGTPVAIRTLPDETIGQVAYHVVAFVRPDIPAWFRIWIDPRDGLVHHDEMLAQGHIMEHDTSQFDTAAPVLPPAGVAPPTPVP